MQPRKLIYYIIAPIGIAGCSSMPNEPKAEPTGTVQAAQSLAPWHLDRIDQRALPLDTEYNTTCQGAVDVYLVGGAIDIGNPQFGGRASIVYPSTGVVPDCTGISTSMAGVIGGSLDGVAKSARIKAVIVDKCAGGQTTPSEFQAALDWISNTATHPSVVVFQHAFTEYDSTARTAIRLFSTSSGLTTILPVQAGVQVVWSNNPLIPTIQVAATDSNDNTVYNPASGIPADIRAPGDYITTTDNAGGRWIWDGTELAAAAVAGVAAQYVELHPTATPAAVKAALIADGTTISTSSQKLVHAACL